MAVERIEGVVDRITFRNDENAYTVLRLELDSGMKVTAVGTMPPLRTGERVQLEGVWSIHLRYGPQFHVTACTLLPPATREAVERYLASGMVKGVGPETARKLVAAFGERALEVITKEPHRLTEVPGIGPKKAAAIVRAAAQEEELRRSVLFLQGLGVSTAYALRIYRQYGADTIRSVRENPYRLSDEVYGIGFRRADAIARALGIGHDAPERAQAAVLHVLAEGAGEGHVFLPRRLLAQRLTALEVPGDRTAAALEHLERQGRIVVEAGSGPEEDRIYLRSLHQAEAGIAERIEALLASSGRPPAAGGEEGLVTEGDGMVLSDEQRQAVAGALRHGFVVITGGPGTGKTTVVRALYRAFTALGWRVALAAPTGRAAQRLAEATGQPARTIHRLLEVRHASGQASPAFARNEDRPLEADAVVVDEASMVDTYLMRHLLAAVRPGTRLVLIGDEDQLPSVGPGFILRDILASGRVPVFRLTKVFRQAAASLIVENAHRVRAGLMPVPGRNDQDFFFLEADREALPDLIIDLVCRRLPRYLGGDPVHDIQVLTPVRRGPLGVDALNARLQERLNPPSGAEVVVGAQVLRPGDKVMQVRNNYDAMVFNGDIGRVVDVVAEQRCVEVTFPDDEGERVVRYDEESLDQLQLAYAVSVHKSQGSEYPCVVMPITWVMPALMTRNLLYTALTRAKRLAVLAGDRRALAAYVRNDKVQERYTSLAERLTRLA